MTNPGISQKAILEITVSPKSSKSEIRIDDGGNIKAYINSPPVDGKANAELIKLLSKKLHIAKSRINIAKGDKGRKKMIVIGDISTEDVVKLLK